MKTFFFKIYHWFLLRWYRFRNFINNIWIVYVQYKSEPRIFSGWGHYWLAKKYADKRTDTSKVNTLCGGKRHFVYPYGQESLIVRNRLEFNACQNKGLIGKKVNYLDVLKYAFYISK